MEALQRLVLKYLGVTGEFDPEQARSFKFGNGQSQVTLGLLTLPVELLGKRGKIMIHVVDADAPLSFSESTSSAVLGRRWTWRRRPSRSTQTDQSL